MRQNGNTSILHGDDPWGALSALGVVISKSGVVTGDGDTDHEGSKDVEEQDTPENTTNSLRDVLTGVGGLTSGDGDHLDTTVREGSIDKGRPETSETTSITSTDVLLHRTLLPVPEAASVVVRSTTEHDDKSDEEQAEDGDDLDRRKDELRFTIDADGEDVEGDDDHDDDGNPNSRRDLAFLVPEVDDKSGSRDFGAESNGVLVPIVPTMDCQPERCSSQGKDLPNSEAKSGIRVTSAVPKRS